jgi:hypothetical protein
MRMSLAVGAGGLSQAFQRRAGKAGRLTWDGFCPEEG